MQEYKIKIHADALDDIQNATDWYNKQSKGLGKRFQKQVIQQINKLKSTAQLYAIRYEDVRLYGYQKISFYGTLQSEYSFRYNYSFCSFSYKS